ncbi:MAG: hypothetical protein ACYC5N_05780 [Endomicrobiales bacterium]
MEKQQLEYPHHFRSGDVSNKKDYICLTFNYDGIPDAGKKIYSSMKLPQKTLRVFGHSGIIPLKYKMTTLLHDKRYNYQVFWKVYIDGMVAHEGSKPLSDLQFF